MSDEDPVSLTSQERLLIKKIHGPLAEAVSEALIPVVQDIIRTEVQALRDRIQDLEEVKDE